MEIINIIVLILVVAVLVRIIMCYNFVTNKTDYLNDDDEQLSIIPTRITPQYCPNCGDLNLATCSTCANCGICVTGGVGKCVPGNSSGPYFEKDCEYWNHQPYVYNYEIPSYINYNYTYDLPHHIRHSNHKINRHPTYHRRR